MPCSFACLNVRGIREREKRYDVLNFLRSANFSVTCLTDTHVSRELFNTVRAEWGGEAVFSPGTVHSRGIAVLFKSRLGFNLRESKIDEGGNYVVLDVDLDICGRCTMAVLYGPNEDDPRFFSSLFSIITEFGNDQVIIVGDWNVALNPGMDTAYYASLGHQRARKTILEFMEAEDLIDIWRTQHVSEKSYTWRRSSPLRLARLDFFLISSALVRKVVKSNIMPGYRTDHSLISIDVDTCKSKQRGLYWKFNNSLLKDPEYVNLVNKEIIDTKRQYAVPLYVDDVIEECSELQLTVDEQLFFEVLLCKIRGVTIAYGARKKRESRRKEEFLLRQIQILENLYQDGEIYRQELDNVQHELGKLRNIKLQGAAQRARVRWVQEGESPSKYFCGLEKRRSALRYMTCLNINGIFVNENDSILQQIQEYYSELYHDQCVEKVASYEGEIGNDFPKLSEAESEMLEGPLTLAEASRALADLSKDKSPGTDGFSVNFFKFFWRHLGGFLVRSLNRGYQTGLLSKSQRQGIITLIPKGNKPRQIIQNWRPISLLNTSYKILSKAMANRMRKVLYKLINADQKGFMKGRFIAECTRTVYDVMWDVKHRRSSPTTLILMADFQNAFDCVDHDFMQDVLKMFKFGNEFRNWVRVMSADAESTICQNGASTAFFKVKRGCRQGDCCSPYLFILCAEILAIMTRKNQLIRGYAKGDCECKIQQYADDTTFILEGSRDSVNACLSTLKKYSNFSGLKLNFKKTTAFWAGPGQPPQFLRDMGLTLADGNFKLLGIEFSRSMVDMTERNVRKRIEDIANVLKGWLRRRLSLYGKRTVVKTLALSMLTHIFSVLPSPSNSLLHEIQTLFFKFIWEGKRDRLKRTLMYTRFNIPNVALYDSSLKIAWVKRTITAVGAFWNVFLTLNDSRFKDSIITGDCSRKHFASRMRCAKHDNLFWRDVWTCWDVFKASCNGLASDDFYNQPLHLSSKVLIGGSPFWNQPLFAAGCRLVGDLFGTDGVLKPFDVFYRDFPIPFARIAYYGLIRSVRRSFGQQCLRFPLGPHQPKAIELLFSQKKGGRTVYKTLLNYTYPTSNELTKAEIKWNRDLNIDIDWPSVYWRHVHCTRNRKIIWFQDRLLHRILTTNAFMAKFTETTADCSLCQNETETLIHLFFYCNVAARLWSAVGRALSLVGVNALVLDEKAIILGIDYDNLNMAIERKHIVQQVILLFKFFIYRCKVSSGHVDLKAAFRYVKCMINADRPVNVDNSKIEDKKKDESYEWANNILSQNVYR